MGYHFISYVMQRNDVMEAQAMVTGLKCLVSKHAGATLRYSKSLSHEGLDAVVHI